MELERRRAGKIKEQKGPEHKRCYIKWREGQRI
jgi:hypothetical protein